MYIIVIFNETNDCRRLFEIDESDNFSKIFDNVDKSLESELTMIYLTDKSGNKYYPDDMIRDTILCNNDELWLKIKPITGEYLQKRNQNLWINNIRFKYWKDNCYNEFGYIDFRRDLDISIERVLYGHALVPDRHISPVPEEFLPGLRGKIDLPKYEYDFINDVLEDENYKIHIRKSTNTFKYLDNLIEKPSRFCFDVKEKYTIRHSDDVMNFIVANLKATKSVISGSWILNDFCSNNFVPGDIDIFSESLDFLCLFRKNFDLKITRTSLTYNSSFMSYEINIYYDGHLHKINYIHVNADGCLTNNIENSSQERVLHFIKQRFDLSCCIISYDGEFLTTIIV